MVAEFETPDCNSTQKVVQSGMDDLRAFGWICHSIEIA